MFYSMERNRKTDRGHLAVFGDPVSQHREDSHSGSGVSDGYFTFSRVTEGLRLGLLVPGVAGPGRGGSKCLGGAAGARPERKRWRSAAASWTLAGTLTLRQTRHTVHGYLEVDD